MTPARQHCTIDCRAATWFAAPWHTEPNPPPHRPSLSLSLPQRHPSIPHAYNCAVRSAPLRGREAELCVPVVAPLHCAARLLRSPPPCYAANGPFLALGWYIEHCCCCCAGAWRSRDPLWVGGWKRGRERGRPAQCLPSFAIIPFVLCSRVYVCVSFSVNFWLDVLLFFPLACLLACLQLAWLT